MTYSLVIPLKNEAESLLPLYKELKNEVAAKNIKIVVDNKRNRKKYVCNF